MRKTLFSLFLVAIVLLGFTSQSMAALTISNEVAQVWGGRNVKIFDIAFDSSYAYGGESLTKASRRLSAIDHVIILPRDGYTFEYDETNEKVKVFAPAPPIVYEEQQTIATNAITLNYPAAYIMAVSISGSSAVFVVDTGATLSTSQCKPTIAFAKGVRSGLTFNAGISGVALVTYVTQAWKDVWENLVQSEAITVSSLTAALGYNAIAIQSIGLTDGSSTTNYHLFVDKDDTAVTGEAEIDWTPATGENTNLTVTYTGTVTGKATYIKKPSTGFLVDNWVEEETASMQSGTSVHSLKFPILLWGYCGQIPANSVATSPIVADGQAMVAATTGSGYIKWGNSAGSALTGDSGSTEYIPSMVTVLRTACTTATYVKGVASQIPGIVPLEVMNARNLSLLTGVQVIMIGR